MIHSRNGSGGTSREYLKVVTRPKVALLTLLHAVYQAPLLEATARPVAVPLLTTPPTRANRRELGLRRKPFVISSIHEGHELSCGTCRA